MAEGILLGAAMGGGTAMLTGQDPLKGAALGGALGGATAGFGGAGVTSGAAANAGSQSMMQTLATPKWCFCLPLRATLWRTLREQEKCNSYTYNS